jgi:sterol desaturase/sphingolipid hydroxylase (fatty acid hydroxylase superfamily)
MTSFWIRNELNLHWYLFLIAFILIGGWEMWRPRKAPVLRTMPRWTSNFVLMAVGNLISMFALPFSAVMVASLVQSSPYGVLNRDFMPFSVRCVLTFFIVDLIRYAQHYLYHSIPVLWRLHQVHHSDADYDLTTSLRFHPGEAILTQGSYLAAIALLAPPPVAVLFGEMVLVFQTFFGHANAVIPARFDALLRLLLVTPDMHRIHHSEEFQEQQSNYGGILSWWDRLFGTYVAAPAKGEDMKIGLRGFPIADTNRIYTMLALPFQRAVPPVDTANTSELDEQSRRVVRLSGQL